uniref:Uncharacterized protein n=1 Tax=viral metagenome TaxID=1070528 RepID=A0A6C0CYL6_9ZZZZ
MYFLLHKKGIMPINIYDNINEPPKKKRKLNNYTNVNITGYFGESISHGFIKDNGCFGSSILKNVNKYKIYTMPKKSGFFGECLIKK